MLRLDNKSKFGMQREIMRVHVWSGGKSFLSHDMEHEEEVSRKGGVKFLRA